MTFPTIDQAAAAQGCSALPGQLRFVPRLDRPDKPQPQDHRGDERQRDRSRRRLKTSSRAPGPSGKLNGVNVNFVPFTAKIPPVASADMMLANEVIGVILGGAKASSSRPVAAAQFPDGAVDGSQGRRGAPGGQVQGAPAQRNLGDGPVPA